MMNEYILFKWRMVRDTGHKIVQFKLKGRLVKCQIHPLNLRGANWQWDENRFGWYDQSLTVPEVNIVDAKESYILKRHNQAKIIKNL